MGKNKLRDRLYSEVNRNSSIKKREINYILGLIQANPMITKLLGDKNVDNGNLEKSVFENTRKILVEIEDRYSSPVGITYTYQPEELSNPNSTGYSPVFILGWIESRKMNGIDAYHLFSSEEGLRIVNDLRKIRKQISIEERNKRVLGRLYYSL